MTIDRTLIVIGAASGLLAVAAGAFGAHLLRPIFAGHAGAESTFETAVRYHMVHSLALLAAAWAATRWPVSSAALSGWMFLAGIVLFSGSLYLLALTGIRWLGAVAPLGGLAFILGWALLGVAAWRG